MSDTYKLIAADLNKIEDVESALLANGLCWDAPTLLLSEVVLTYLPPERYLSRGGVLVFVEVNSATCLLLDHQLLFSGRLNRFETPSLLRMSRYTT